MRDFSKVSIWRFVPLLGVLLLSGCGQSAKPSATARDGIIQTKSGIPMVFIPAGKFMMGVNQGAFDAKPAHEVHVDAFLMDQHEVTQTAYQKLMGENPSRYKNPNQPVEQISWARAIKFCNARSIQEGLQPCYNTNNGACNFKANGYRLPTEAEWEYACRAGTTTPYYFGDRHDQLQSHAWFAGNSQSHPHPVARWKPNAWGLYDMAGNVWEWCNDFYGATYYRHSPTDNPRGPDHGDKRVLRGGAFSSEADNCTSWVRNCDEAGFTDVCLTRDADGFRCVRRPTPQELAARARRP